MKTILPFFLVSVLGLYCSAQENAKHENGDIVAMKQVQSALNTGNAPAYASVFDENATWDGPLGQNAIGPENIKRAAYLMFRTFGPLQFAGWKPKKLSTDILVVDMYQKVTNAHSNSWKDIPTAPGSIAAPYGSDLRTTLVLKKQDKGWRVIVARVADLRLSKAKDIRASVSQ
jgi:ketosteroid isomerase-like protein